MHDTPLFRWMKSANIIIFFGVGLLLMSVLGYAAYQIYRDLFRERIVSNVINPAEQGAANKTKVSLGTFSPIEGTPYYLAPIAVEQNYRQDYYDKTASSTQNYLFLNPNDQSAVRLVPKNDWLFLRAEPVGQKNQKGEVLKAEGLLYEVVKTDTDGDKRLTERDQRAIAVSSVSGQDYTELVPKVDQILGSIPKGPTTVLLIYTIDRQNLVTEINVETKRAKPAQALPALE